VSVIEGEREEVGEKYREAVLQIELVWKRESQEK
jgi:hypothetical protein